MNLNTIISFTKNLYEFFQDCHNSIWVIIEENILFSELNTISVSVFNAIRENLHIFSYSRIDGYNSS